MMTLDKDGSWAVDLFPVVFQISGENPATEWSAAPHLRWSARTRVSLTWQVMSYHWNSQGSEDGPG